MPRELYAGVAPYGGLTGPSFMRNAQKRKKYRKYLRSFVNGYGNTVGQGTGWDPRGPTTFDPVGSHKTPMRPPSAIGAGSII